MIGAKKHLDRLGKKFHAKVQAVKKKTSYLKERLKVAARSPPTDQEQIVILFLVFALILVAGPLIMGWLVLDITSVNTWITLAALIVLIVLLNRASLIPADSTIGLILFIVLNMIGGSIFIAADQVWLQDFFGGEVNAAVGTVIFFLAAGLVIVRTTFPTIFTTRRLTVTLLIVVLLLSSTYLYGYVSNDSTRDNLEFQQAQLEAKSFDIVEVFTQFFNEQLLRGQGNYTAGELENTFEFVGLEILQLQAQKNAFSPDEDVIVDVDYQSNIPFDVNLYTTAKIDGIGVGEVDEPQIEITSASNPSVRINFGPLPRGAYTVDVIPIYNYESTVRIPLKIMDANFAKAISNRQDDPQKLLEEYVGGADKAITTQGPVRIGVSTSGTDLQAPLLYSADDTQLTRLRIQLHEDELKGEVFTISEAVFDVPAGMQIQDCDFGTSQGATTSLFADRVQYSFATDDIRVGTFETFSCNVVIEATAANNFMPDGMWWTPQTLFFTLKYTYKDEASLAIRVTE